MALLIQDEEGEIEDPDHVAVNDEEMEELLMEIQNKREQPTPPPPLLLYTAHRTEGSVARRCLISVTLVSRSRFHTTFGLLFYSIKPMVLN